VVEERLTWDVSEKAKSGKTEEHETAPIVTGGIRHGFENAVRIIWTMMCFSVFCGFSFFLGWHLRGWHFSAYYEAPDVDMLGAKTAYHAPAMTQPTADISQAEAEEKQ
jgi:hypothetical protein